MSLYSDWLDLARAQDTQEKHEAFWTDYYQQEKRVYEQILSQPDEPFVGTFAALSDKFEMTRPVFAGFIDGINTSLESAYDLEAIKSNSKISLKVDLDKLYFNMLEAKADWLYELPQWDAIFTEEERDMIRSAWKKSKIAVSDKTTGRNEPCPCGSGKKYKKCCGAAV